MAANLQFKSTPLRERVSKEEWDVRVDLAAAYQLAAIFKWTDLIYTHFSARVPGAEDFLVNPYGLMFDEITASNLVKVDPHGMVLDDPTGLGYNEAGFVIHGCMHEARPEINCVLHTHTRAGVAVSAHKCGLLPISQHAMMVQQQVAYHDYEGIALEMDERSRMARDLGKTAKAMILRNHGLLTLGETVREAFELMYYLDCACQIQIDAMALDRQHRAADRREVFGDVPAPELGIAPDVGPAVEGSLRVAVVAPELVRQLGRFKSACGPDDRANADRLDEHVRRHRHHGLHLVPCSCMDQGNGSTVGVADQDGIFDFQAGKNFGQGKHGFVVHESHAASGLLQHVGLPVAVAVVHERAAAEGLSHVLREVAPLPDRAETFVQEHQHRPAAPLCPDPFILERAAGRRYARHGRA